MCLINIRDYCPPKICFILLQIPEPTRPCAGSLRGRWGTGSITLIFEHPPAQVQKGSIHTPATSRCSPPDSRYKEGKGTSSVSADHTPCNGIWVWNWFRRSFPGTGQVYPFAWSLRTLNPSTWPLNSQPILMEWFGGLSYSGYNVISLNCTLAGTPPRGKNSLKQCVIWNKPCGCLMSRPGFHHYKRSLTTDLSFPCILQQQRKGKSYDSGLCRIRCYSKYQNQGRKGRNMSGGLEHVPPYVLRQPALEETGSQQLDFIWSHHLTIRHKEKKVTDCLSVMNCWLLL